MDKIHLRIGSARDNQFVIDSMDVAPYHLELFCDTSGNVFITDLGSEQGTFVNKRRLDGFQLLKKGDQVRFGQSHMFRWEEFLPVEKNQYQEIAEPIMPPKTPQKISAVSNVSNKQLYVIYGCILFLIVLMSLYL